jgi:hypothetical protein
MRTVFEFALERGLILSNQTPESRFQTDYCSEP